MRYVKMNDATVERFLKEGRGQGEGQHYKPWIYIGELPSSGRTGDPMGHKTGRPHQLLSQNEINFFNILEWASDVVDIREQFPLSRTHTLEVAREIGASHPYYPGTHDPAVMTVDFLVTKVRDGKRSLHGYDIKETSEAEDFNSLTKLEITRETLERIDIPHELVFSSQLPKKECEVLAWIQGGLKRRNEMEPYEGFFAEQSAAMAHDLAHTKFKGTLAEYCADFESRASIAKTTGLRLARMLMQAKVVIPPLSANISDLVVSDLVVTAMPGQPRLVSKGQSQ